MIPIAAGAAAGGFSLPPLGSILGGLGGASSILGGLGGSTLSKERYLQIWTHLGFDVNGAGFQRWLFGKRGNNMSRAGALTADIMIGKPVIVNEASQWYTGQTSTRPVQQGSGTSSAIPLNSILPQGRGGGLTGVTVNNRGAWYRGNQNRVGTARNANRARMRQGGGTILGMSMGTVLTVVIGYFLAKKLKIIK